MRFKMTLKENLISENQIQQQLFDTIDSFNCFRFNAGAGAGKTYALVETIKYILETKEADLNKNHQNIICITYTNVAANEIKERLGNTQFVSVSTIHEMLWDIIKQYDRSELILLHKQKIENEITIFEEKLNEYRDPSNNLSIIFNPDYYDNFLALINATRSQYYDNKEKAAAEFKKIYDDKLDDHVYLQQSLRNVQNFKSLVELLYKKDRYIKAVQQIDNPEQDSQIQIKYDSLFNNDKLASMKFSHDTLLIYSFQLIEKYPTLCRIIADKYPYVFIDEYQDSHENVVKFFQKVHQYSQFHNKNWLVGYFGDTKQNIYDDGVGDNINNLHADLISINKGFNRRSHEQITNLINKIRNDDIKQIPIDPNRVHGNIQFFHLLPNEEQDKTQAITKFLTDYRQSIGQTENIHCLIPLNKSLANLNGFKDVYHEVNKANFIFFNDFNTKFITHQLDKLDPSLRILYNLIKLHINLKNDFTTYYDLLGNTKYQISFNQAKKMINNLRDIKANNLNKFIQRLSKLIHKNDPTYLDGCILAILENTLSVSCKSLKSYKDFYSYLQSVLLNTMYSQSPQAEDRKDQIKTIKSILNVELEQFVNWVNYIDRMSISSTIQYHTYHGSKGEEYDNVAIIMENNFGERHGKNKFLQYFSYLQDTEHEQIRKLENENYKKNIKNTQNLIYVACSRAKKNLRILYLDDIAPIKTALTDLFGDLQEFN